MSRKIYCKKTAQDYVGDFYVCILDHNHAGICHWVDSYGMCTESDNCRYVESRKQPFLTRDQDTSTHNH